MLLALSNVRCCLFADDIFTFRTAPKGPSPHLHFPFVRTSVSKRADISRPSCRPIYARLISISPGESTQSLTHSRSQSSEPLLVNLFFVSMSLFDIPALLLSFCAWPFFESRRVYLYMLLFTAQSPQRSAIIAILFSSLCYMTRAQLPGKAQREAHKRGPPLSPSS